MGKKKEKITYVDDGRTLADMSGVSGSRLGRRNPSAPSSSFKDKWNTYWTAVKMMFLPMLATMGMITLVFGVLALIFYLMYA